VTPRPRPRPTCRILASHERGGVGVAENASTVAETRRIRPSNGTNASIDALDAIQQQLPVQKLPSMQGFDEIAAAGIRAATVVAFRATRRGSAAQGLRAARKR